MAVDLEQAFRHIRKSFKKETFFIPVNDRVDPYFPTYFTTRLQNWLKTYKEDLQPIVDSILPFSSGKTDVTLQRTEEIIARLPKVITLYYDGKVLEATSTFNSIMDELFHPHQKSMRIPVNTIFFRSRSGKADCQYSQQELFHLPFELRHQVASNRYSIPGFPALYLADSTYTCWEESNRFRLRDLHFSRFENTRELKVIDIRLIDDFFWDLLYETYPEQQALDLLSYISIFPLILACTIPVHNKTGNFKPEYIIPQLLLQYVSARPAIDGIRFPSTKINYETVNDVPCYNYVFPVRSSHSTGYCDSLTQTFHLTEPTSLELEEVLYNPQFPGMVIKGGGPTNSIEVINGVKTYYVNSSFHRIETVLKVRPATKLPTGR